MYAAGVRSEPLPGLWQGSSFEPLPIFILAAVRHYPLLIGRSLIPANMGRVVKRPLGFGAMRDPPSFDVRSGR